MDIFPLVGDAIPAGYKGWILFLDELSSASPAVQAAAYKILLDRMVGQHKLHPNCFIVGAGNLETDNAVVEPMSTALASRLVHVHVRVDLDSWVEWAINTGNIDHRILSYVGWKKLGALYNFTGSLDQVTFACPRTWKFTSDLIKGVDNINSDIYSPMINGTIGEAAGREFVAFLSIYKDLPELDAIIANPTTIKLPEALNVQYALIGALASMLTADNANAVLAFIGRFEESLQFYAVKYLIAHKKDLINQASDFMPWVSKFTQFMVSK
jgi:hypothetical protein